MYRQKHVTVVIPAYNVERFVGAVLKSIPDFVDQVIVVDDAATDDTAGVLRGVTDPRVAVVRHPVNQGVGGAMISGFKLALERGTDVVVKMDGDGQMDPRYLPALLDPVLSGACDYAKGNRFLESEHLAQMPTVRLLGNFALTFLTKLVSGYWNVFDPQNGFVAIDAAMLRRLPLDRLVRRYFFENDMLIHLNIFHARVRDVPIPARYGEEHSSMRLSQILVTFPVHLARRFWYRIYQRHILRDFSAAGVFWIVGTLLLTWGFLFGSVKWIQSVWSGVPATTGTVMLSALPVILGFQLLLQAILVELQDSSR
jgi:dolichol-phosphate mannosyltransferase